MREGQGIRKVPLLIKALARSNNPIGIGFSANASPLQIGLSLTDG